MRGHSLPILVAALLSARAARAEEFGSYAADKRTAAEVFWRYSACIVGQNPTEVERLLRGSPWRNKRDPRAEERLATPSCTIGIAGVDGVSSLSFKGELFDGALAGAWLSRKYHGSGWPSLATRKIIYDDALIAAAPADRRGALALLAFAECVARKDSSGVGHMIDAMPFSPAETTELGKLQPLFNDCIPVAYGAQVRFSRQSLRGLLAEAAYDLDAAPTVAETPGSQSQPIGTGLANSNTGDNSGTGAPIARKDAH